jgi:nucleoside phosphorylase
MVCLPDGDKGTNSAAFVAAQMMGSFPSITIGLMVGIGGGVPEPNDVRLGDVVVSVPGKQNRGVVQHDFGTFEAGGVFRHTRVLNGPPPILLSALTRLQVSSELKIQLMTFLSGLSQVDRKFTYPGGEYDRLFDASYEHQDPQGSCDSQCDPRKQVKRSGGNRADKAPVIHYGAIASGNQCVKDAMTRDALAKEYNVLCFEMEAAGLMNNFPCLVIRGISDYSDSHKNNRWKGYAAAAAAAYAKVLLMTIPAEEFETRADTTSITENKQR